MVRDGVDVLDPEAVDRWVRDFNSRSLADRDAVLGDGVSSATTGKQVF
jgi:hypothetical protein